jgi:hypothetical protein
VRPPFVHDLIDDAPVRVAEQVAHLPLQVQLLLFEAQGNLQELRVPSGFLDPVL